VILHRGQAYEPQVNKSYKVPSFELGQAVKIKCIKGNWHTKIATFKGTIIFLNENHVTVKGENYCSSFTMAQFKLGEVILLNA